MTPRTYTPKISSPPRINEVEQSETELHGAGPVPWTPGGQSSSEETQSKSGGILVRHAPDEDVGLGSPRARGSSPSLRQVQDQVQVQDEMSPVEGSQLTPSTGRGRGLAALVRTSEVGRTRSPSPLSSTTSPPSNILKSANLQKMLEKSPSAQPAKSPQSFPSAQPSKSPQSSPSSQSSKSPKSSTQPSLSPRPLDEDVVPRPGIHKPLVIPNTTRQPFMRDVSVRPKQLPSLPARTPRQSETKSPPTFVSPVRDSKLPWKHRTHRGASQQSPSSSDWNKMSSTSGQSDVSEGEVTTPVRAKTTPTSSPSERAKIIQER